MGLDCVSRWIDDASIDALMALFCTRRQQSNRDISWFGAVVSPLLGMPRRVVMGEGR